MDELGWARAIGIFREVGFPLAGVTGPALPEVYRGAFQCWLESVPPSQLGYMRRGWERRLDARAWLPWARSIICAALPYNTSREVSIDFTASGRLWVSRYAWGEDYHGVVRQMLEKACEAALPPGARRRVCIDSSPLLEKAFAREAGLGFFGRNGLLINPEWGSFLFLGEVVTDIGPPGSGLPGAGGSFGQAGCGDCRLCEDACPAGAISGPGSLDSRRCLSAWNIEWKGPFPGGGMDLHGQLFGCDICQEVCPYNSDRPLSTEPLFVAREPWFAPEGERILGMEVPEWEAASRSSPLARAGFDGIKRNASSGSGAPGKGTADCL